MSMRGKTSGDWKSGKSTGSMPPRIAPTVNWPSAPMFQTLAI
jgi:hypothetical protein